MLSKYSLLPRIGIDVWRINLPVKDRVFIVTQSDGDHLPSPTYLFSDELLTVGDKYPYYMRTLSQRKRHSFIKAKLISPSKIWNSIRRNYRIRMGWRYDPPLHLDEPETVGLDVIETKQIDLGGREDISYCYYHWRSKALIISEIYDTGKIDELIDDYKPRNVYAVVQPANHVVIGGLEIGRYKLPLSKLKRPTRLYLLKKSDYSITVSYAMKELRRQGLNVKRITVINQSILSLARWSK